MRRPARMSGYGVSARSPRSNAESARTRHSSESKTRSSPDHLGGKYTAGVYPLLPDDTCWFVALDFDEASWMDDVAAFVETSRCHALSPAVERSRSGNGAHVWFFFTAPVPARDARDMASFLLTETMRLRRELKLESYDRLFPSQDTLPQGGFGNLIALPFQFHPRKLGHSLFVDSHFEVLPWDQQWQLLADIERIEGDRVRELAREAVRRAARARRSAANRTRDDDDDAPWKSPSAPQLRRQTPLPGPPGGQGRPRAAAVRGEDGSACAPAFARLRRIAAFQNPEFYKRQKLRLSTARMPRIIVCAEDLPKHLALPRACVDDIEAFSKPMAPGSHVMISAIADARHAEVRWHSHRSAEPPVQGMLAARNGRARGATGIGQTVMGARIVAARGINTLVLVHRRPLLDQWMNQLALFLGSILPRLVDLAEARTD